MKLYSAAECSGALKSRTRLFSRKPTEANPNAEGRRAAESNAYAGVTIPVAGPPQALNLPFKYAIITKIIFGVEPAWK